MIEKIFISQKSAIKTLTAVGFSGTAARAAVGKLKKFPFGKREKVKTADVRIVIRKSQEPPPAPAPPTMRPIKWRETVNYLPMRRR